MFIYLFFFGRLSPKVKSSTEGKALSKLWKKAPEVTPADLHSSATDVAANPRDRIKSRAASSSLVSNRSMAAYIGSTIIMRSSACGRTVTVTPTTSK